jgi:hypothetical protein
MKKILAAAILTVAATAGTASAGGAANTIGVGTEFQLSGVGGLSVNYDAGKFHAGGFVGLADPTGPSNTQFDIGGRFFFHVAATASADFSVGGSIGIRNQGQGAGNDSTTGVFIEPGFQIRAFIVPNVALSFTGGLSIGAADADGLILDSQIIGIGGVHYYF